MGVDVGESFGSSARGKGNSVLQCCFDLGSNDGRESRGLGLGFGCQSSSDLRSDLGSDLCRDLGIGRGDCLKRSSRLDGPF